MWTESEINYCMLHWLWFKCFIVFKLWLNAEDGRVYNVSQSSDAVNHTIFNCKLKTLTETNEKKPQPRINPKSAKQIYKHFFIRLLLHTATLPWETKTMMLSDGIQLLKFNCLLSFWELQPKDIQPGGSFHCAKCQSHDRPVETIKS